MVPIHQPSKTMLLLLKLGFSCTGYTKLEIQRGDMIQKPWLIGITKKYVIGIFDFMSKRDGTRE